MESLDGDFPTMLYTVLAAIEGVGRAATNLVRVSAIWKTRRRAVNPRTAAMIYQ